MSRMAEENENGGKEKRSRENRKREGKDQKTGLMIYNERLV